MVVFFGLFFLLILLNVSIVYCMLIPCVYYLTTNGIGLTVVAQRLMAGVDSFPLLAVPLFVLAGQLMNGVGITKRIFNFCDKLVGHITGGLAHANIIASVIFAGMSGSAIADAGGLGAIELQAMKENGYDEDFSLAITGASSIIGPIIPPSVPAIVFAACTGISVGKIFIAGVVPGLIMAAALGIACTYMCRNKPELKKPRASTNELWVAFKAAFFPLLTPVIILYGTFSGVFTPTETSGITVLYCIILGLATKDLKLKELPHLLRNTARTTVSVTVLIACSALFGYVLTRSQFPQNMAQFFTGAISNKYVMLIMVNILLLIVGTFMDNSAAIPILGPILVPIAIAYGVNEYHFALIFILNLMLGLLTPPVGLVLYTLTSVSRVPFERISKAMLPFLGVLIVVMLIITFIPQTATWLPAFIAQLQIK